MVRFGPSLVGEKNDLKSQETLLRIFSKKVYGLNNQSQLAISLLLKGFRYSMMTKIELLFSLVDLNERSDVIFVHCMIYQLS